MPHDNTAGSTVNPAFRLLPTEGWGLTVWEQDPEEPRIPDYVLAERLGYSQPRDIRKLIGRVAKEGRLGQVYCRATVARQLTNGGGSREYTVNEYHLTEAQALKVSARSDTDKAEAILDEMIRVFILARRGLLPGQLGAPEVRALLAELVTLRAEQAHMRRQMEVAADERRYYDGAIGIEKAKLYITGESARAADLLVRAGLFKSASAAKKSIETKLRHRLGHVGGASDWDLLPMRQLPAARRFLVHERREAERACRRLAREQRAKERQASLKLAWPQP